MVPRETGEVGLGGGGGVEGLQKGILIVSDGQKGRRTWTIPEQSGWYGRGREKHMCNNEGRQWTGQFASGKQQRWWQPNKQERVVCSVMI